MNLLGSSATFANWAGEVIKKCDFSVYAKTTRQRSDVLDSEKTLVKRGDTYKNAAWAPNRGDPDTASAGGVTIKLETEDDDGFVDGHVYQVECTSYHYYDGDHTDRLSSDLPALNGQPFSSLVSRKFEILDTGGKAADLSKCPPRTPKETQVSYMYCASHKNRLHGRMAAGPADAHWATLIPPALPHPLECYVGKNGFVRFTLCA
ncbi:hypothetical protein B0J12DRAFT_695925 [Macrophomina phaseolina]|uniref:Uncharacterized protein n=1 Tax=Macrophomina phaseolina TaxID=35725 RepID=A0ABQ8GLP2_9PEZI|nr:hypothetical protein B0J12DRAFT_695925 [Macrophomina phaseolina]